MNDHEEDRVTGMRARIARLELQLSADAAASQLQITEAELMLIESGEIKIESEMVAKLATVYNQPVSWFFDPEPRILSEEMSARLYHLLFNKKDTR